MIAELNFKMIMNSPSTICVKQGDLKKEVEALHLLYHWQKWAIKDFEKDVKVCQGDQYFDDLSD
jgi:hypothetical protein